MQQVVKPRVSVAMPVYNGENYITAAVDSILGQTFADLELIITDNASTDSTEEICRAYAAADQRVRYFRNAANLGAARNYNLGVELSQGEYFKWAAHDDRCAPSLIEACVAVLDQQPQVVMAYGRTILIDEDDQIIEYHVDGFHLTAPTAPPRLRQSFHGSAWCHPVFGVIRSSVLAETGLIGAYPSSDKVLLGELAIRGQCFEVPEHLAYRRLHPAISTEVNKSDEAMAAWFDPAMRQRVLAPRWRRLLELSKAIARSPLSWHEQIGCYGELARFYLAPGRLRGATRDVSQIGKVLARSVFGRA